MIGTASANESEPMDTLLTQKRQFELRIASDKTGPNNEDCEVILLG